MIVRINYRESFSRTVGYVMKRDKFPELVGGNLSAKDPNAMIGEFGLVASLNTRCKKPVAHLSFSLSRGETLSAVQWAELAERVAADYGFEQYAAVRHHDTDCEHIHVVGNRIKLDGKAVATSNDRHRMRTLCQRVEKDFGLVNTSLRSVAIRVNKDELERSDRLYRQGKSQHPVPPKLMIAEQVKANSFLASDRADFSARCHNQGISVRWRPGDNGQASGVSFGEIGGDAFFSGTSIGLPLSRLNHTLRNNGKTNHSNNRSPATRLATAFNTGTGNRPTETTPPTGTTPYGVGGTGAPAQQTFGNAARGATDAGRDATVHINQEQKIAMINMIEKTFLGVSTSLIAGLEGIDDALNLTMPMIRIKQERSVIR